MSFVDSGGTFFPDVPHTGTGINRISDLDEDVLHLIFEHFDLQPSSSTIVQTRKDLLSAATTCRAFVEPALNSLWRVLPSFLPLLLLLPSAEVRNNRYVSPRPSLYLSRNLTNFTKFIDKLPLNIWERFDIHAPRVRSLFMEWIHIVISPHVYLLIRSLRHRDNPLLPGLKEICIPTCTPEWGKPLDFSSALLLASDSPLKFIHLEFNATSDSQFCIPFLILLSVNSSNLTHLTLYGTAKLSLEFVICFRNLQSLDLRLSGTYLNSQFLQDLGKLDNLLDLTLETNRSYNGAPVEQSDLTLSTTNSTFIQLRRLHILGDLRSISRVLDHMHNLMNLTTLLIHDTNEGDENPWNGSSWDETDNPWNGSSWDKIDNPWNRCFANISTFTAIKDIQINQSEDEPMSRHYALSTSSFYPLYKLNNITSFVIKKALLLGSDDDFRFLACAFPKLEKFVEPRAVYTEGRTLACLFHFSQANRHLRKLKISVAFDISHNLKAINLIGRPTIIQDHQHPLESLHIASDFGTLSESDMVQVAEFLDLIFPNLTTLKAYGSLYEISSWRQIQEIRVALQAARIKRHR